MDEHPLFRSRGPKRTDEKELIRQAIWLHENGHPAHAQTWEAKVDFIPEIGRSPAALYKLIYQRKVNGKGFLGHGTWEKFKEKVLGIPLHPPDDALVQMDPEQLRHYVKQLAEGKPQNRRKPVERNENEKNREAETLLAAHQSGAINGEQVLAYLLFEHHNLAWDTVRKTLELPNVDAARRLIEKTGRYLRTRTD